MGIQGLMKLIADYAPSAMKDLDIKNYFGGFLKCQIFYKMFSGCSACGASPMKQIS